MDTQHAYQELWPFETKFWEKELSVGRTLVSRSSLFFNQWLISRVGEEVGPKSTFTRFKYYVEHEAGTSMKDLLALIREQADRYEAWTLAAEDPHRDLDVVELNVYRTSAAETEVLKPVLLWLTEPGTPYGPKTVAQVVAMMESWLVRRLMLRLPSADHGRVIADLVSELRGVPDGELPGRMEAKLRQLTQRAPTGPAMTSYEPAWRPSTPTGGSSGAVCECCSKRSRTPHAATPEPRPRAPACASPARLPHRAPAAAEVEGTLAG